MHTMLIVALMIVTFMIINPPTFASGLKTGAAVEQTQSENLAENNQEEEEEEDEEDEEEEEEEQNASK